MCADHEQDNEGLSKMLIVRAATRCNAGCFMCEFAGGKNPYYFSSAEARNLAVMMGGEGYCHVRFTGGEPLLVPDIADTVAVFSNAGLATSLITNGWFLEPRAAELVQSGLGQTIVSLDGATAETHDAFRGLSGLYERLLRGIDRLRNLSSGVVLRVNTVAGAHNLGELPALYDLLRQLMIDQWSIIPLKHRDGAQGYADPEEFKRLYARFCVHLRGRERELPALLGYSPTWAGRSPEEIERFAAGRGSIRPKAKCRTVRFLRFYDPEHRRISACNCAVWRGAGFEPFTPVSEDRLESEALSRVEEWLYHHGPSACRGCEPINAASGDGCIDLSRDPYGF